MLKNTILPVLLIGFCLNPHNFAMARTIKPCKHYVTECAGQKGCETFNELSQNASKIDWSTRGSWKNPAATAYKTCQNATTIGKKELTAALCENICKLIQGEASKDQDDQYCTGPCK